MKIKRFVASPYFFYLILAIFTLQAVWFAGSIHYKIPPDESYHFQLTEYYSDRSLFAGPIINDQDSNFILGDIERAPSYLYHYILSFPLKISSSITDSLFLQVLSLRFVNILFGTMTLLLVWRIFRLLNTSPLVSNISLAMLSMTGMFVWISAAINYDNLAVLSFVALIYASLLFIKHQKLHLLLWIFILSIFSVLVKITLAPVVVFLLVSLLVKFRNQLSKKILPVFKKEISKLSPKLILLIGLFLVVFAVFSERIGGNVVEYQAITPSCASVHTHEECSENGIYKRAQDQNAIVEELHRTGQFPEVNIIQFAANWVDKMYSRLYFFFGHKEINANQAARNVFFITMIFILVLLVNKSNKILKTYEHKLLFYVTAFYILLLFFFNLNSFKTTTTEFGFQGRYLLPIIPFVYLFICLLFANVFKSSSRNGRTLLVGCAVVLASLNIYHHFPGLVFLRGSNPTWYTSKTVNANKNLKDITGYLKIAKPDSLKATN